MDSCDECVWISEDDTEFCPCVDRRRSGSIRRQAPSVTGFVRGTRSLCDQAREMTERQRQDSRGVCPLAASRIDVVRTCLHQWAGPAITRGSTVHWQGPPKARSPTSQRNGHNPIGASVRPRTDRRALKSSNSPGSTQFASSERQRDMHSIFRRIIFDGIFALNLCLRQRCHHRRKRHRTRQHTAQPDARQQ